MKNLIAQVSLNLILLLLIISLPAFAQPNDGRGQGVRPAATVSQLPPRDKRFALIIGVNKYSEKQITQLSGAERDAKSLSEALIQYAGFPRDQVVLLTTAEPEERQPKRSTILSRLSNLRGAVPKDGLLLIAFAGHGMERGGKAYLLPTDAVSSDDVSLLEDTAISVNRMRGLIEAIGVKQVMFLLDACRNDPAAGRSEAPNLMTDAYRKGFDFSATNRDVVAFVTLYATAIGQRAYEYDEKSQGYFTWAFIEGLKGAAANQRGEVTLGGLKKYVEDTVPRMVQLTLGKQQKPFADVAGYKAEELVLSVVMPPAPTAPPVAANTNNNRADELFWEAIKNSKDERDYKLYLQKFPNGIFAEIARQRALDAQLESLQIPDNIKPSEPVKPDKQNKPAANNSSPATLAAPLKPLEVMLAQRDINEILNSQKVEFRTGTDQLTDNGKATLMKIMDVIKLHLVNVEIGSHTDNMGDANRNLELSQRRAEVCRQYIIQYLSIKDRVMAKGYGMTRPVAGNDTAEGRAANRRIEFKVLSEYKSN